MIILDSTSESIVAYLAGVVAANQPEFVASYADHTATTFTEGGSEGVLNNTTEVTIVEPPAAATRRAIKSIYIHNKDTATVVVTVEWASGATRRRICKVSLPADRTLAITEKIEVGQETAIIFSGAVPADNAIARFDGESGWVIQRSLPTIDDAGSINIPAGQTYKINDSSLTLDNILDGATYGRVKLTSLTGNEVVKLTDASGDDLTVALGGANRIITLSGNPTLGDWFDQSLKQASSPTFAGLTLTGFSGFVKATGGILSAAALSDEDIPDTITLTNITQITNRSHTNLTDIGTLTHATIDSYLDQAVKQASSPVFVTVKLSGLTDGYLPYHISDATGLANSPIYTDGTKVSIGTPSPLYNLEVYGDAKYIGVNFATNTSYAGFKFAEAGTTIGNFLGVGSNFSVPNRRGYIEFQNASNNVGGISFWTRVGGTDYERMRIDNAGNVLISVTAAGTSAAKVLGHASGTAPTTAPADMAQMWVADINATAGKAGFHMMAESGTGKLIIAGVLIKTDTGDPAQVHEGLMCINTFDNTLKMYCEAAWRQLATW